LIGQGGTFFVHSRQRPSEQKRLEGIQGYEKRSLIMDNQQRPSGRSLRGFASMDKEKQKAIASKGGRAAHEKGTAHEFNSHEASMAAKKGHERGTAHEFTAEEARIAGRKGGLARAMNRAKSVDRDASSSPPAEMSSSESPQNAGEISSVSASSSMGGL
jgi:general stress protein YciG